MFKHFKNYYWKGGKPYGKEKTNPSDTSFSYKIVVDPYYKRFSIEKYHYTSFDKIIYDSYLLDFRHLTLKDQMAWQREILKENQDSSLCLLRNQEDRVVLMETLTFEGDLCRTCQTSSVHGIPLSIHRMYYQSLNDHFNGVVLYDVEERPIMMKVYEIDSVTGEFTALIQEEWNMQNIHPLLQTCLP